MLRKQYSSAEARLQAVIARRTDEVGAEAQYRIGELEAIRGEYREAVTQLLRVKYVYPGAADWIARAFLKLGECYIALRETAKAKEAYLAVISLHKEDEFGREADKKMKEIRE